MDYNEKLRKLYEIRAELAGHESYFQEMKDNVQHKGFFWHLFHWAQRHAIKARLETQKEIDAHIKEGH